MWSDKRELFGRDGADEWSVPLWLQIAVGVTFGVLLANGIELVVAREYLGWQLSQASAQMRQSNEAVAARARADRQLAADNAVAAESERVHSLVDEQRRAEAARVSAVAEAARREHAWAKFYKPSPGCIGSVATLECANEHMRFKREFDASYAAGKL
jgi:hypothetical protein